MTCYRYCGVTCCNGNCPLANEEEYKERGIPVPKDCEECPNNYGCEDCAWNGTEKCTTFWKE